MSARRHRVPAQAVNGPFGRTVIHQVENAAYLRGRMAGALLDAGPSALLDVGCGRGELLGLCREAGVPGVGLEASVERARALPGRVALGRAEQLPFGSASVPWAVMRHAAHHLSDPQQGIQELARVATDGVLVAEPWRPPGDLGQETARALDDWCKAHHRRRGRDHGADIAADQLTEWLRAVGDFDMRVEFISRPLDIPLDEVEQDLHKAIDDLPPGHDEYGHVSEWLERARRTGVGATGTVLVIARSGGKRASTSTP